MIHSELQIVMSKSRPWIYASEIVIEFRTHLCLKIVFSENVYGD